MKKLVVLALIVILVFPMATGAIAAGFPADDRPYHLLLLGIDTRDPDNWDGCRTDTIIIVTILKSENRIKFTSLMRDTYLAIPDNGYGRINAAYACGGAELTVRTIQENFGVSVDDYIVFDFDFVRELCDALGGITVRMNASEARVMNKTYPGRFSTGKNELNGDETLTFCRIRKGCGNDFERTRRQRDVLKILFSKIPSIGQDGLLKMTGDTFPSVKTSINNAQDFLRWGVLLFQMRDAKFSDLRIPIDGGYRNRMINKMAVLLPNMQKNVKAIQEFLGVEERETLIIPMLKKGSSGEEVQSLQNKLIELGLLSGTASGDFDQLTVDAVKAFQRANGISADGVVGPETLGYLYGVWR